MPPAAADIVLSSCSVHVYQDVDLKRASINSDTSRIGSDFETAMNQAGIGKFQKILLIVSGVVYATCAISSTTLSFVLPVSKCDFQLTSADKGKLSAMPLVGMLLGCCLWGSLADSKGRKISIILSLLVDFIAAVISSQVSSFSWFLTCRFFNGFGIIGATSIVFSYLGEFLPAEKRDKYLGKLEIFWNVGVIILPGVAWCFLSKKMTAFFVDFDGGNFSPWRIFVLVCSLPSLISLVLLYFMPETPKYLMAKGKYEKAKHVFRRIYTMNTGQHEESYPVKCLEGEACYSTNCEKSLDAERSGNTDENFEGIRSMFRNLVSQHYLKYLGITSFADFGLMASYYTLVMWFPNIFDNFNEFELQNSNASAGVCEVTQVVPNVPIKVFFKMSHLSDNDMSKSCDSTLSSQVFYDTFIIGLSCIPTSVSLSYFMQKFGKKIVLVVGLVASGISTLSLNFVRSSTQTLVLSCAFEAIASIMEAVLFCIVVDLFPTNLRALALAVTATSGRLGAIFGNIIFGLLLDVMCVVPIYLLGFLLIASGTLCLAFPKKENYIPIL